MHIFTSSDANSQPIYVTKGIKTAANNDCSTGDVLAADFESTIIT